VVVETISVPLDVAEAECLFNSIIDFLLVLSLESLLLLMNEASHEHVADEVAVDVGRNAGRHVLCMYAWCGDLPLRGVAVSIFISSWKTPIQVGKPPTETKNPRGVLSLFLSYRFVSGFLEVLAE